MVSIICGDCVCSFLLWMKLYTCDIDGFYSSVYELYSYVISTSLTTAMVRGRSLFAVGCSLPM